MNSFNFHPTEMAWRGVEFTLHFDSRQQPCERSSYNGNANFTSKRFNMTPHTSEAFKIQLPDLTTTEQSSEFAENVWKRGDEETRKVFPSPRRLSLAFLRPVKISNFRNCFRQQTVKIKLNFLDSAGCGDLSHSNCRQYIRCCVEENFRRRRIKDDAARFQMKIQFRHSIDWKLAPVLVS